MAKTKKKKGKHGQTGHNSKKDSGHSGRNAIKKAKLATLANGSKTRDPRLPAPGTVIEREYKGKVYKITVLDSGFRYNGEEYGSLTAVAKAVRKSDVEINGFAFFSSALQERGAR